MQHFVKHLLVGILLLMVASGCRDAEEPAGNGPRDIPRIPVQTGIVERGRISETAHLVGSTRFPQRTHLLSETSGRALEIRVREGDAFKKDEILVKLDDSNYRIRLAQEEALLQRSRRLLDEMQAGTRDEVLAQLQAAVKQAEASLRQARDEFTRTERLFQADVQTEAELIRVRATADQAEARLQEATARYEEARNGPREVELRVAEADIAVQQAKVDEVKHDLAKTEIRAPYDGVVLELHTDEGAFLSSGSSVMGIASHDIEAMLEVPERFLRYLQPGRSFEMTADAFPGERFAAEVITFIPSADVRSRNFQLRARLLDHQVQLVGGMFVRAELPVISRDNTILVPDDAVTLKDNILLLFTLNEDGTVTQHVAKIGLSGGAQVELIVPELEPGTVIITTGNEVLYDGALVNPAAGGERPAANAPAETPGEE